LKKSPRLLAQALDAAEDKDKAAAACAAAEKEFSAWLEATKAAIAAAEGKDKENASIMLSLLSLLVAHWQAEPVTRATGIKRPRREKY